MAEEKTGTEQVGDAGQPTGVEGTPAVGQPEPTPVAEGNQDEVAGLKAAAVAEREKRQAAEEETQQLRDQMAVQQANQPIAQLAAPQDIYEQLGLGPEDYPTVEQQRQIDAYKEQQRQVQQVAVESQRFANSHSDFGTAVGQLHPISREFMPSVELQKIWIEKPYLRASCNTAEGAYKIVMEERKLAELVKQSDALKQHQVQQQVDNQTSPMSPAAAGGGAVDRTSGEISETSNADDVRKMQDRVKSGEFEKRKD